MMRLAAPTITTGLLLILLLMFVDIRSDAGDMLGPAASAITSLDSPTGRELVLALEDSDVSKRNAAARDIAAMLTSAPLVAQVQTGPEAISSDFLEWLWLHRFRLNPPVPQDLTVANLTQRLAQARATLGRGAGLMIGDRLLRDPTGSFATLLERQAAME
ncbi:MAG: hypothetical protein V7788_14825, partial [Alphaproteobacteria bacterium]